MDRSIPRWQYPFENDRRAYGLLRDAIELSKQHPLTDLEREGGARPDSHIDLVLYGDVDGSEARKA